MGKKSWLATLARLNSSNNLNSRGPTAEYRNTFALQVISIFPFCTMHQFTLEFMQATDFWPLPVTVLGLLSSPVYWEFISLQNSRSVDQDVTPVIPRCPVPQVLSLNIPSTFIFIPNCPCDHMVEFNILSQFILLCNILKVLMDFFGRRVTNMVGFALNTAFFWYSLLTSLTRTGLAPKWIGNYETECRTHSRDI